MFGRFLRLGFNEECPWREPQKRKIFPIKSSGQVIRAILLNNDESQGLNGQTDN